MAAGTVFAGAGQGSGSFLFLVVMHEGTSTLRLGFLFPFPPTGLQFGNSLLQPSDALLAIQGLGLPPIAALLEERKQLVGRTRITTVFRDGFHEPLLGAQKNRSRTKIALTTKISFSYISPRF
jgi:hypothetical protein